MAYSKYDFNRYMTDEFGIPLDYYENEDEDEDYVEEDDDEEDEDDDEEEDEDEEEDDTLALEYDE